MSLLAPATARLAAQGPSALESKRGVHPRLFLDAAGFSRLKSAIRGTHAALWELVRQEADRIAAGQPPRYEDHYREGDSEQLWQRGVGSKMPYLAMAHALTGEPVYLKAAKEWALASCGYPHWGLGIQDGCALSGGHQLVGLAVLYDWLYRDLDPPSRDTIRRTLLKRCRDCFVGIPRRRKPLLQNHLWVPAAGLVAAGLAVFDEAEAAAEFPHWMDLVIGKFRGTEAALGCDGASHEGVGYWSYGVEYMLKYWHLASELLGENLSSPWWRNTAAYRLYLGLPRNSWTRQDNIVDLADCPRSGWYGPDYLLRRLAHLYRDGHAQWLAQELNAAGINSTEALWLNLVWYDPSVPARPPADLPTLRHFADMEIVSGRSGWSGDESLVVFKCGPPAGHEAKPRFEDNPGIGHVHPDASHFILFGAGEWLIRDDGYLAKMTDQHNTLLIEGRGQLGEGGHWLEPKDWYPGPKSEPRILKAACTPEVDEIIGDATAAYPEPLGLRQFTRRLYFLKPDVLIVVDEIELREPRGLELRFHPEYPAAKQEDGSFLCRGRKAVLRVEPLTIEEVQVTAEETPAKGMSEKPLSLFAIRLTARKARWRNAVAFSWAPLEKPPARLTLERHGPGSPVSRSAHDSGNALWIFRAGARKVFLNWDLRPGS
jgi:hypothetical protein